MKEFEPMSKSTHGEQAAGPAHHDADAVPNGANAWERPSVTFRLTEERRRALLALAPELGMRASPTAAIDFAIERAAGLGFASFDRGAAEEDARDAFMDELREVLAACAALRADSGEARASLERIESRLDELGAEAEPARIAQSPTHGARDKTPTLGEWLSREAAPSLAWAVVKARWLGAESAEPGKAMSRVDAWAAAPADFAEKTASLDTVLIGPARLGALAAFENDAVGVLVCSRGAQGWIARLHAIDAKGKLGPELDSFNA
ncbi:hypothetical protein HH212_22960 [Massilia forsythiae]|uniref:Uncharacterized protein n=1 Tax=Massilia forsythiae TaxID=2728020 RepID=A0A7Z2W144_9BURK|nr:hypothetical protein [Massilia forsythiae]QJE02527.1 hypothetical protein HH212_22960 [Massilia forsythiae]